MHISLSIVYDLIWNMFSSCVLFTFHSISRSLSPFLALSLILFLYLALFLLFLLFLGVSSVRYTISSYSQHFIPVVVIALFPMLLILNETNERSLTRQLKKRTLLRKLIAITVVLAQQRWNNRNRCWISSEQNRYTHTHTRTYTHT